jgi:Zn-dependent protease
MFERGIPLFNLMGFSVRIDASWFVLVFLITWTLAVGFFPFAYPGWPYTIYLLMGLLVSAGLFFSVLVHEFAHARVGQAFGVPMGGITLFLFGGLAEMEHEAPGPKAEFLMTLAGPLTSVLVLLLFWGLTLLGQTQGWPVPIVGVTAYLASLNGLLILFNLIPAFPLDGGRLLRAALWHWQKSIYGATRITSRLGVFFGVMLMIWGLLGLLAGELIGGIWRVLIGMFLKNAAGMAYRQLLMQQSLKDVPIRKFIQYPATVSPDLPVHDLLEKYLSSHPQEVYPVVESGHLTGCVDWESVREFSGDGTVRGIMKPCVESQVVSPDMSAASVLSDFDRRTRQLMVVDDHQRFLGTIYLENILNFISIRKRQENPS